MRNVRNETLVTSRFKHVPKTDFYVLSPQLKLPKLPPINCLCSRSAPLAGFQVITEGMIGGSLCSMDARTIASEVFIWWASNAHRVERASR
jgi:hypothetical protein